MVEPLTIVVAQPVSRLGDVEHNVARHAELVSSWRASVGASVVVFPELSLTGYALDAEPIAPGDGRLRPLVEACARSGSVALVGAATRGPSGRARISTLRVGTTGVSVAYDKIHLGGDEPHRFEAGDAPAAIEVAGWRLGLAICRDTGVAAHASATAGLGIDVYVAGVCEHETDREVQPRRAAEVIATHGIAVAVASFAGPTGGGFTDTAGRSTIWLADGTAAASAGRAPGTCAVARMARRRPLATGRVSEV